MPYRITLDVTDDENEKLREVLSMPWPSRVAAKDIINRMIKSAVWTSPPKVETAAPPRPATPDSLRADRIARATRGVVGSSG